MVSLSVSVCRSVYPPPSPPLSRSRPIDGTGKLSRLYGGLLLRGGGNPRPGAVSRGSLLPEREHGANRVPCRDLFERARTPG